MGGEPSAVDEVPTKTKPRSTLFYAVLAIVLVAAGATAAVLFVPRADGDDDCSRPAESYPTYSELECELTPFLKTA